MTWTLLYVLLSSGVHSSTFPDERGCIEAMIELELVTKKDLWSATCTGPNEEHIISTVSQDIGP